jgi:predicted nucleotide-binding protein (sugar kinase/HSP70/actin superfamily)
MPTAGGPCRFGQYATLLRKVLDDLGYDDVLVFSPSSSNSYDGVANSLDFLIMGWWSIVSSDILLKVLLKTRPYELEKGQADEVYSESLEDLCRCLEDEELEKGRKLKELVGSLTRARDRFRSVPANYSKDKPFIGVVGEIFCRLNDFSNNYLIRKIEEYGGECWLSDVSEWIWYTNNEQLIRLREAGKRFSPDMLKAKLKNYMQRKDEHRLMKPFHEDFIGYEEPAMKEVLESGEPYLPYYGALGEMALSVGKAVCLYQRGADGIVDISPFTCMNGTVSEAIYPALHRDCDGIPMRVFYFDENQSDLDRDVGIFIELAKNYKRKKKTERLYPSYFKD